MIQSNAGAPLSLPVEIMVGEEGLSGDVNQDNLVDILDVVITVNFVIGEIGNTRKYYTFRESIMAKEFHLE